MRSLLLAAFSFAALAASAAVACSPVLDARQEARCYGVCQARASRVCSDADCERGCRFILDRIVEREDSRVVGCVAAATSCGDEAWAMCAARVGVHADGGPPVPPPLKDDAPEEADGGKADEGDLLE